MKWKEAEYETKDGKRLQHGKETNAFLSGTGRKHNPVLPDGLYTLGTHQLYWNTKTLNLASKETGQSYINNLIFCFF